MFTEHRWVCVYFLFSFAVTSYAGVWIEILVPGYYKIEIQCHALCGRVDWNCIINKVFTSSLCHALCGRVDWNINCFNLFFVVFMSRPMRACGLKSADFGLHLVHNRVTPYAGVWIEIPRICSAKSVSAVTPCAGVWKTKNAHSFLWVFFIEYLRFFYHKSAQVTAARKKGAAIPMAAPFFFIYLSVNFSITLSFGVAG